MKRGFTLIELLTAIAIIAMLAAILFPVFATARRSARSSACLTNLRQIGISLQMYAQDYGGTYPYAVDPSDRLTPQIWDIFFQQNPNLLPTGIIDVHGWLKTLPMLHEILQPYQKSRDIWRCPNDFGFFYQDLNGEALYAQPSCFQAFGTSFMFRTEIAFRRSMVDNFVNGSSVVVLVDGSGAWHTSAPLARDAYSVGGLVERYRYNTLFADLHVKNIDYFEMSVKFGAPLE